MDLFRPDMTNWTQPVGHAWTSDDMQIVYSILSVLSWDWTGLVDSSNPYIDILTCGLIPLPESGSGMSPQFWTWVARLVESVNKAWTIKIYVVSNKDCSL